MRNVTPGVDREGRSFEDPLAEQLAWLMDSSIGLGRFSIGLDALIGLIPGLGDVLTTMVSVVIVGRALQNGVHRSAILRMLMNLGIDTALGSVPIVGDVFDATYKANVKNMKIYRESMSGTRAPLKDWAFIAFVVVVLLLMIVLPLLGLLYIMQRIISSWPQ
jgi:hypothetical protein